MMAMAPKWMPLAYKLAEQPDAPGMRIALQLPKVLGHGASTLEVARHVREAPETVAPILEDLASANVIVKEGSGLSVAYTSDLYYIGSEGMEFFRYLSSLGAQRA